MKNIPSLAELQKKIEDYVIESMHMPITRISELNAFDVIRCESTMIFLDVNNDSFIKLIRQLKGKLFKIDLISDSWLCVTWAKDEFYTNL